MDYTVKVYSDDLVPHEIIDFIKSSAQLINTLESNIDEFDKYISKDPKIHEKWKWSVLVDEELTILKQVYSLRRIIKEQIHYLTTNDDCKRWLIIAKHEDMYYGGVMVFYHPNVNYLLFQGITKYTVPFIQDILDVPISRNRVKLNTLLIPKIEELATSLGINEIRACPINNQGNILEKHYGFTQVDWTEFPSKVLYQLGNKGKNYYRKILR